MPFTDSTPASWLGAGYNAQSGKIELNTNNATVNKLLTELTDSEADETTGDIRKLMFGVLDGLFVKLKAKNDALLPADRPQNFTFNRASSVGEDGVITRSFNFTFRLSTSGIEVANEPV
jgi:hypothetical protein